MTNHDPICSGLTAMAERELSSFFTAVTELFGPEQAEISAEDWLRQLMASDDLPGSPRHWRSLSIMAASRLAARVNASVH